MTAPQESLGASVARMRERLDEIEKAQAEGDSLLALELAQLVGDSADSILWSATALARRVPGTTWTVIGGRLGISRQAAHQRLGGVE